eukprot:scaffold16.g144.t1
MRLHFKHIARATMAPASLPPAQGETLGTLRHGRGVHTCASGDQYEGQWRYNKREGRGKMVFVSGLMYEGEWRDDKAHGQGMARYENGGVYVGDWQDDHRWGWGTHRFPNRDRYEGEWHDDRITGKFVTADGSSEYSGGWKDNQRSGYGVQYERGRYKYMGTWQADLQHGEGKCIYADGSTYDGEWKDGLRHGRGKYSLGDNRYEGGWQEGRQHGAGCCQLDSGDRYVGEFHDGKRHGRGRCAYADGARYEGEWADDVRCGAGTCVYANGDKYKGEWKADRRHGQGSCKFADGTRFRGEWEDDAWVQSAADPARCRVAGPGVTRAVAGQAGELVIEARDEQGNKRLSGGDEFKVHLRGPASLVATVADEGDGSYAVTYTATIAGVYELHITNSPYPLRMLPGRPTPRKCAVRGEGRRAAVAGRQAACEVVAHDEFGNRWHGDADKLGQLLPLEAKLIDPSGADLPVALEPTREGLIVCTYTAAAPGYHRLHIDAAGGGAPLPGTPFSVLVVDADAPLADQHGGDSGGAAGARQGGSAEAGRCGDANGDQQQETPTPDAGPGAEEPAAHTPGLSADAPAGARGGGGAAVPDLMRVWEQIAAAAYGADGSLDGWDSDSERRKAKESSEDAYIKANPGVPVVENLEDIWMVSRLQRERKAKEERQKQVRLAALRKDLEEAYGAPAPGPSQEEVVAAVKEIIAAEKSIAGCATAAIGPSAAGTAEAGGEGGAAAARAPTAAPASGLALAGGGEARLAQLKEAAAALDEYED